MWTLESVLRALVDNTTLKHSVVLMITPKRRETCISFALKVDVIKNNPYNLEAIRRAECFRRKA